MSDSTIFAHNTQKPSSKPETKGKPKTKETKPKLKRLSTAAALATLFGSSMALAAPANSHAADPETRTTTTIPSVHFSHFERHDFSETPSFFNEHRFSPRTFDTNRFVDPSNSFDACNETRFACHFRPHDHFSVIHDGFRPALGDTTLPFHDGFTLSN